MKLDSLVHNKERYYERYMSDKAFMSKHEWGRFDRKISDKIKVDEIKVLAEGFGIKVPVIFSSATGKPLTKKQISQNLVKLGLVSGLEEAVSETDKLLKEGISAEPYSPYYTHKIYKLSFEEVVNRENIQVKYIPRYERYFVDERPREGMD